MKYNETKKVKYYNNNKTKKVFQKNILKGGYIKIPEPTELTKEQINYYKNFMEIKSDATKILHKYTYIKNICIKICQELTSKIYNLDNDIFKYIKQIVVPEMFDNNHEKIIQFIENEMRQNSQTYYDSFIKIQYKNSNDIIDIENYLFLFCRFYLKGGNAFIFTIDSYNKLISSIFPKNQQLSDEEITNILGDRSDYDFNFLINANLSENHYYQILLLASKYISFCLIDLIYKYGDDFFNNIDFIEDFKLNLLNNEPNKIYTEKNPKQIFKVKHNFNQYVNDTTFLKSIKNDENKNKLGYVSINYLDIEKKIYSYKGKKKSKFILIRLMTCLKNSINYINDDNILKEGSDVAAEIIDVSIPSYDSYERIIKWENEAKTNIKINNVYCYNLNIVLDDLKRMIHEDIELNKTEKLKKRQNRLLFFNNLVCIIPRLIYSENELENKTGLNIEKINDSCEQIITFICNKEIIEKKPKVTELLKKILRGIYFNFPETINNTKLNIFTILKQTFYYYLIENVNCIEKNENNYDIIAKNLNLINNLENYTSNEWKEIYNTTCGVQYFNIIQKINSFYICDLTINYKLFETCFNIIDELKSKNISNELLCDLLIKYSILINSFEYSDLKFDALILFADVLNKINNYYQDNNIIIYQELINSRKKIIYVSNYYNSFIENFMKHIHFDLINFSLSLINEINLNEQKIVAFLNGSYAYAINKLHHNYDGLIDIKNQFEDENIKFNNINIIFGITNLNNLDKYIYIYNSYKFFFEEYFNNILNLNQTIEVPCKIYLELKSENNYFIINGIINIYYPLNNDDININFQKIQNINNQYNSDEKFRILTYTFLNIKITNEMAITKDEIHKYSTANQIINEKLNTADESFLLNKWFGEYNKIMSIENKNLKLYKNIVIEKTNNFMGQNIIFPNIINDNFYILNSYGIVSDSKEKINSDDLDILIKKKHINLLLNY